MNYVGVDVNTASASLLNYVSGLNKRIANNVIKYRDKVGRFTNRKQLMDVSEWVKKHSNNAPDS